MRMKAIMRRLLHPSICLSHVTNLDGSLLWCVLSVHDESERSHEAANGITWRRRGADGITRITHPKAVHEWELRWRDEKLKALESDLWWMRKNASDAQLLAWAECAGERLSKLEDTDPDWERRYANQLTSLGFRLEEARSRLDQAVNDQEWDIKISKIEDRVQVVGKLPIEQVPALLYRLAALYGGEQGISVEESLCGEVERFRKERNEARQELAKLQERLEKAANERA